MDAKLINSAKNGDQKARKELLAAFDGMISSLARLYASKLDGAEPYDDLLQVGRIGFLEAVSRFDENIAPAFIPYAKEGVKIAIRDYLNSSIRLIRLPKSAVEGVKVLSDAYRKLSESGNPSPEEAEVMEATGFTERRLRNAERNRRLQMPVSLDYQYTEEGAVLSDFIDSGISVEDDVMNEILVDKLSSSLSSLSVDDRFIITSLHGSFGADKLKVSDIAAKLDISEHTVRNRVRRIEGCLYRAIS